VGMVALEEGADIEERLERRNGRATILLFYFIYFLVVILLLH
jgi:hypothetical protein